MSENGEGEPWDIRNPPPGAPRDEERRADHRRERPEGRERRSEAGAPARRRADSPSVSSRGGYSGVDGAIEFRRTRSSARSCGRSTHTHFLLEGEKPILEAVAAGVELEHVLHDSSVRPAGPRRRYARPKLVARAVRSGYGRPHPTAPARGGPAARRAQVRDPGREAGPSSSSGSRPAIPAPWSASPRRLVVRESSARPDPPTSFTRARCARAPGACCGFRCREKCPSSPLRAMPGKWGECSAARCRPGARIRSSRRRPPPPSS